MREPSEAQPKPILDTLLPMASTKTRFMAKTRFHSGIKPAGISMIFCLSVKDRHEAHHSFAAIAAGGLSSAKAAWTGL
jgi:hypothetical protein